MSEKHNFCFWHSLDRLRRLLSSLAEKAETNLLSLAGEEIRTRRSWNNGGEKGSLRTKSTESYVRIGDVLGVRYTVRTETRMIASRFNVGFMGNCQNALTISNPFPADQTVPVGMLQVFYVRSILFETCLRACALRQNTG